MNDEELILNSAGHWLQRIEAKPPRVAIYFLFKRGALVYVGQTINIAGRMGEHRRTKDFDSAHFMMVDSDAALDVERAMIYWLRPKLNKTGVVTGGGDLDADIVIRFLGADAFRERCYTVLADDRYEEIETYMRNNPELRGVFIGDQPEKESVSFPTH